MNIMEHNDQLHVEAEEALANINKKTGRNMPQAVATGAVLVIIILASLLIRIDAVRAAWAKRITLARDALLQIPHRLAPVLAAESDMERVSQLLEDELRQVLDELSRGAEAQGA